MFVRIFHEANIPVVCAIFVYRLCEINLIITLYVNSDDIHLPVPFSEWLLLLFHSKVYGLSHIIKNV